MDNTLIEEFKATLNRMIGQRCWSAQISGVGSLVSLNIGDKIKRDQPMVHPDFKISVEERFYRGAFILYVEDCPWRIETRDSVLATWLDESTPGGSIDSAMSRLIGSTVESVELLHPGLDLWLHFEGGLTLRVFPDQVDAEVGDNYSVSLANKTYIVAARSMLYAEDA